MTFLLEGAKGFAEWAGGARESMGTNLELGGQPSRPNRGGPDCTGALNGPDFCLRCLEFAIVTCWGLGQH